MTHFKVLAQKEFLLMIRGGSRVWAGIFLCFMLAVIGSLGVSSAFLPPHYLFRVVPTLLWMSVFVSSVIFQERSYDTDLGLGALDAILLTGVSPVAIFFAKGVAAYAQIFLGCLVSVLCFEGCLGVRFTEVAGRFLPIMLVAIAGFSALVTLMGAISWNSNLRGLLFPLLILPMLIPLYLAVVELTVACLIPGQLNALAGWWVVLLGSSALYIVGGAILYSFVLDA